MACFSPASVARETAFHLLGSVKPAAQQEVICCLYHAILQSTAQRMLRKTAKWPNGEEGTLPTAELRRAHDLHSSAPDNLLDACDAPDLPGGSPLCVRRGYGVITALNNKNGTDWQAELQ